MYSALISENLRAFDLRDLRETVFNFLSEIRFTMTRDDHLCYCCVCTKRTLTQEQGFICSLTNKIADFDPHCATFVLDKDEKHRRNEPIRNKISQSLESRKPFVKKMLDNNPPEFFLTENESGTSTAQLQDEIVIRESRVKKIGLIFLSVSLVEN